jgi:NADH-quinone oxidoreductase subunit G
MANSEFVTIDGIEVPIEDERNLLEMIRKAGIDLPTFCYHSELSVYGACRLCIVDIEGRGLVGACSMPPEPNLKVRTSTEEIRELRRVTIELLLANGHDSCPTCARSDSCQLQTLARRLGISDIRFKRTQPTMPIDRSSPALVRDPNKCVLCGDCVRACSELQGIGAIDFAFRGAKAQVMPAFGKDLDCVECVHCGQCARVCPTGALSVRSEVEKVWKVLDDRKKVVVAQIAPAVRVALGEEFGLEPGVVTIGQIVAALRKLGFAKVYDTCFTADMTIVEEATEFLARLQAKKNLPQFTSCCPAWVQFAQQYCADLLPNMSSCRSPQQMFGSVARETLPELLNVVPENLVVVSIMPCVAKKVEADLPQFARDGRPDVDFVITTQELARMIKEAGLRFRDLQPDSLDLPLGFKTGAGVIFGATGGVSEAVLRYASERVTGRTLESCDFHQTRGDGGKRELRVRLGDQEVSMAIVCGLKNAKLLVDDIRNGRASYDFIEVMACPGGCVGGAGQPLTHERSARIRRAAGLYEADKMLQLHKPQDNHMVTRCYEQHLGEPGGHKAHELLHRTYQVRRRIEGIPLPLLDAPAPNKLPVNVCVGTNCHVRGAQKLLQQLLGWAKTGDLEKRVELQATFCYEHCDRGPTVAIGSRILERCTFDAAKSAIETALAAGALKAVGTE